MSNYKILSAEEEKELAIKMKNGDKKAREIFINSNTALVVHIAKDYKNKGISFLDIVQEGNIGLIIAADKFDPEKGYRFSTYAAYWIKQRIRRSIISKWRTILMPDEFYNKGIKYIILKKYIKEKLNHEPTKYEISEITKIPVDVVDALDTVFNEVLSLNKNVENEGREIEIGELVIDKNSNVEDECISNILTYELNNLIDSSLTDREKGVIEHLFGLNNKTPKTLEEIGKIYGVTKERIRVNKENALNKLRKKRIINSFAIYTENEIEALNNIKKFKNDEKINKHNIEKEYIDEIDYLNFTLPTDKEVEKELKKLKRKYRG